MKEDKHNEAIREVLDTITDALNDPMGIVPHQRRLMAMLSLGTAQLVELYFHKLNVIKPGSQIKHEWFKQDERKIRIKLSSLLTANPEKIPKFNDIIFMAAEIEKDRDTIVYGSPLSHDKILREKIELFIELKKLAGA